MSQKCNFFVPTKSHQKSIFFHLEVPTIAHLLELFDKLRHRQKSQKDIRSLKQRKSFYLT